MYMADKAVVDASIVAKWFINESDSQLALIIHDLHISGKIEIHAPALMIYEVLNAALYCHLFSVEELGKLARALLNYHIVLHSLTENLAINTTRLAQSTDTTIYDAAYVALAEEIGCKFYTADSKLVRKMSHATKKAEILSLEKISEK